MLIFLYIYLFIAFLFFVSLMILAKHHPDIKLLDDMDILKLVIFEFLLSLVWPVAVCWSYLRRKD
jgi:hypothetical protein